MLRNGAITMNDKFARTIKARGLTVSNKGATVEYADNRFLVDDVKYSGDSTFIRVENWVALPNDAEIRIWD